MVHPNAGSHCRVGPIRWFNPVLRRQVQTTTNDLNPGLASNPKTIPKCLGSPFTGNLEPAAGKGSVDFMARLGSGDLLGQFEPTDHRSSHTGLKHRASIKLQHRRGDL